MAKKSCSLDDFEQLCLLGEGAYSAVYKVKRLADNDIYALKKVKLPSLSDKEKQNALNEVRLLASVQDPNIIAYKEAFFDDKTRCLCIVTECADGGDLMAQINRCQKERAYIHEAEVWKWLAGMCQGLKALHDMRILHRDLKGANVFLHNDGDGLIAKLGDFNVSKVAKRGLCMTQTGTPYYASPEVWRDMPYDSKSDMWSLGCVVYELCALKPPFRAEDMEGLYRKVLRGMYPRIPSHYSSDLSEVIASLLQVNPRHRPSIEQFLQNAILQQHKAGQCVQVVTPTPSGLLNTIKLPKNVIDLRGCLPKPRYDLPKILDNNEKTNRDSVTEMGSRLIAEKRLHASSRPPRSHSNSPPLEPPDSLDAYLQSAADRPASDGLPRDSLPRSASVPPKPRSRQSRSPSGQRRPSLEAPGSSERHRAQPVQRQPRRESRRPMAHYARKQFEEVPSSAPLPQQAPARPAAGGVQLPSIFGRAS